MCSGEILGDTMIWFDNKEFDTEITVNPQHVMPVTRYFFLHPNLKLLDEGTKPEDLPLLEVYKRIAKDKGKPVESYALKRVNKTAATYFDIKKNGFRNVGIAHGMMVTVKKGGLIRCYEGHNRLCMLHHLGSTKPVKAMARIDPAIKKLADVNRRRFYQPVQHPAFTMGSQPRGGYEDRLKYLTLCLRADKFNSLLDIGCYTGYYTVMLAKKFNCRATGIEREPLCNEITGGLQDWWSRYYGNIKFIHGDFLKHPVEKHDVTICLSVLHHYLKQSPKSVIAFVNKIAKVTRKFAIIEVAGVESQMKNVKPAPTNEVWEEIFKQTNFKKVELLKGSPWRRPFFELRKN